MRTVTTPVRTASRGNARRLTTMALVGLALTGLTGGLLTASPATAAEATPPANTVIPDASPDQVREFNALLSAVDDTTNSFDAVLARGAGASETNVQGFATTWVALDAGRAAGIQTRTTEVREMQSRLVGTTACKGRNTWDKTGLQYNVYLSSCKASELARAYATGAASLGVLTAIFGAAGFAPGAAGAGIVGAILGLGAVVVNNCNARGRGVIVRMIPPAIWCNSQ